MFFKECPEFVSLDEITFVKPVHVGDFLNLTASVVYTNVLKKLIIFNVLKGKFCSY